MKFLFLISVCIISFINSFSQESEIKKTTFKYDTTRIIDVSDKLNIYTGLYGKIHSIELNNTDLNKKLKLEPNGKTSIGLGFSYKWIGLGVSFTPGFLNNDNAIYGNSDRFDTQLNIYTRKLGIDAYFQYYKGFYLKNPDTFLNWSNDNYPLRPDLESLSFGLSGYYFFNHNKFSYKAAFTRTQIQKKSAGTIVIGAYLNVNIANSPEGFVPQELPDSITNYYTMDGYVASSLVGSIGYSYTLVFFKRFFINLSLVPGLGLRNAEYWLNGISTSQETVPTVSLTTRGALGYEGKNLYIGLTLVSFADTYENESFSISSSSGNIQFFIGKRFNINKK